MSAGRDTSDKATDRQSPAAPATCTTLPSPGGTPQNRWNNVKSSRHSVRTPSRTRSSCQIAHGRQHRSCTLSVSRSSSCKDSCTQPPGQSDSYTCYLPAEGSYPDSRCSSPWFRNSTDSQDRISTSHSPRSCLCMNCTCSPGCSRSCTGKYRSCSERPESGRRTPPAGIRASRSSSCQELRCNGRSQARRCSLCLQGYVRLCRSRISILCRDRSCRDSGILCSGFRWSGTCRRQLGGSLLCTRSSCSLFLFILLFMVFILFF